MNPMFLLFMELNDEEQGIDFVILTTIFPCDILMLKL